MRACEWVAPTSKVPRGAPLAEHHSDLPRRRSLVATLGGPTMFARISVMQALNRDKPSRRRHGVANRPGPIGLSDEGRLWSVVGMGRKAARQHAADWSWNPLPGDGPFARRSAWSRQGQRSCASIPRKSDLNHAPELWVSLFVCCPSNACLVSSMERAFWLHTERCYRIG